MMVGLTLAAMLGVPVANLLGLQRWLCCPCSRRGMSPASATAAARFGLTAPALCWLTLASAPSALTVRVVQSCRTNVAAGFALQIHLMDMTGKVQSVGAAMDYSDFNTAND
jgi:predicted MFS family arabinose efflux permease